MTTNSRLITTLYWNNINKSLVETQARVFRHLGYDIEQVCRNGMDHGAFLDDVMESLAEDGIALFVDIDCFPMNRAIVERAFSEAAAGKLTGCAQTTEHIDASRIVIAPMFMALSKQVWLRLGKPSFMRTKTCDIAQNLHDIAVKAGISVDYIMPEYCLIPRWDLAGQALFGIGTFYKGGVFHLYQSRYTPYRFAFFQVAEDVIAGRKTDLIALSHKAMRLYAFEPLIVKTRRLTNLNGAKRLWRRLVGGN